MENTIGIDVSKAVLDVHVRKYKRDLQFENSTEGIEKCLMMCLEVKPELIVMEATGGYEYLAAATLSSEGLAVAVVNPRKTRSFAKALGISQATAERYWAYARSWLRLEIMGT